MGNDFRKVGKLKCFLCNIVNAIIRL